MAVVKFKKEPGAKAPNYAYKGDAGLDLFSNENIVIEPMHRAAIKTGIYLEIPEGYVGVIWSKSGLSLRQGLNMIAGIIDSNYRGEIKLAMVNLSSKLIRIEKGDKLAQMLIQRFEEVKLKEMETLSPSVRGEKGFGSSGIRAGKTINNPSTGLGKIKEAVQR